MLVAVEHVHEIGWVNQAAGEHSCFRQQIAELVIEQVGASRGLITPEFLPELFGEAINLSPQYDFGFNLRRRRSYPPAAV